MLRAGRGGLGGGLGAADGSVDRQHAAGVAQNQNRTWEVNSRVEHTHSETYAVRLLMIFEFFWRDPAVCRHRCSSLIFEIDLRHNPTGKAFEEWELKALLSMG